MRKSKKAVKQAATAIAEKEPGFPPEISALIEGCAVRITEPGRFFAKKWRLQLLMPEPGIREIRPNVFELDSARFARFLSCLRLLLPKSGSELKPSDSIAWALSASADVDLDNAQIEPILCYGDNWFTVRLPASAGGSEVRLNLILGPVEGDEPALMIELYGAEPLQIIQDLETTDKRSPKGRQLQKQAHVIWRFLSREIAARLGIEGPGRGRPRSEDHAAWLHDHFGLSWRKVAEALCKEKHKHAPSCSDKYRKQAKLYWKRERKRYEAMARAAGRSSA